MSLVIIRDEKRGYGQRDPLVEYKNEAFQLFDKLMMDIDVNLARRLFRTVPVGTPTINMENAVTNEDTTDKEGLVDTTLMSNLTPNSVTRPAQLGNSRAKLGRNDPCWCGSGKKWKKCHYPQLPPS